ncbi:amastin-like surface protein-like protein [Trypanosoma theileri]|uniref:Amastin-like surface protein-like protein n=1 Tax=Trypanosoma theileri TaxID=67003 RepID=A0A1X0NUH1_9TRYP|nr:amastin-like surface protein-like protein [Trypanosoma theileri]ORC87750.1 amastin-like surface protein-like protein [Trypanosoma theileri]
MHPEEEQKQPSQQHADSQEPLHNDGVGSHNEGMSAGSVAEIYRESFRFRQEPHKHKNSRKQMLRILFCVLCFCSFVLSVVATPLDIFRDRSSSLCLTMWGGRATCSTNEYKPIDWGCSDRRSHINASRAFSILSILLSCIACILGVLLVFEIFLFRRIVPAVISLGASITLVLTWGCIAGVYNEMLCETEISPGTSLKGTYKYGAGFGIFVAAFCLQFVATIVEYFA